MGAKIANTFAPFLVLAFLTLTSRLGYGSHVGIQPQPIVPDSWIEIWYKAEQLQDQPRFIHYGFNGWSLGSPNDGYWTDNSKFGNPALYLGQPLVWDEANSRYRTFIHIPAEARALHVAFCRDDCTKGTWDNNQGKDYNWPITFPYIGPYLQLAPSDDPRTTIRIKFTHPQVRPAWLELTTPEAGADSIASVFHSSQGEHHEFVLTDLTPGTAYRYRVGIGASPDGEHDGGTHDQLASAFFDFRTLPEQLPSIRIIMISDGQDAGTNKNFAQSLAAIDQLDYDIILGLGDYAWSDSPGDWWMFFDKARELLASNIFIPIPGNHDRSQSITTSGFDRYFGINGPEISPLKDYRIGPLRLLSLDTTVRPSSSLWSQFLNEVDHALKIHTDAPWTLATSHYPLINLGSRHYNDQFNYRELTKLISGRVDWLLSAHEHFYQRTYPLQFVNNRLMRADFDSNGTQFLVLPPSGAIPHAKIVVCCEPQTLGPLFAKPSLEDLQETAKAYRGFVWLELDSHSLNFRVYGRSSEQQRFQIIDEWRQNKP